MKQSVVVIGAGVLGTSTAYHLAREGADVTIIDQKHDGRATAAGAGIICPWATGVDDPAFYRLYTAGAHYYDELVAALSTLGEDDLGFRRSGALVVSGDTEELAAFEHLLHQRRAASPEMGDVDLLTPQQARSKFPPLRSDLAALHISGGARVDGRRLAAGLLRAARQLGVTYCGGHAELVAKGHRVNTVRVNNDEVAADCIVVTAGAWAPGLLQAVGLSLSIEPQRGQIVHLRLPGQDTHDWPVVLPPGSHYLLAFDDSRIVVGATRETGAGFDYRVTASGQAAVLAEALQVAPGLGSATIIETRVGFRPVGSDVRPMLGRITGIEGLILGNGLGAAGLTIGPLAGRLLADTVLERPTLFDLSPFDPMRRRASHDQPALR